MTTYQDIATDLHAIADRLATLGDLDAGTRPYIQVGHQPNADTDDQMIALIDLLGTTVIDTPGQTYPVSDGQSWHHGARGRVGAVGVHIFNEVESSEQRAARAETQALREELDRLRAGVSQ